MYYYILILLLLGCFLVKNLNVKNRDIYLVGACYLFFVLIFVVSSLRYGVGSDYFSYKNIFDYDALTEPLFSVVIYLTKLLNGSYYLFVAIIFCISFGVKLFVFSKLCYKKGLFLSLMLFCSFYYVAYEMNAMRQGIALSFSLLAVYYVYIEKKILYWITCLVAFCFHYTALVFIPFYFLLRIKLSKRSALLFCILCAILSFNNAFGVIIDWCLEVLGNGIISYKIQTYSTNESFDDNLLLSFSTIRRLLIFLLILYSYEKINAPERMKQIIFWGGFSTIVIYLLFSEVGYFSTRLSVYFRVLECVWLSYFPFIFKRLRMRYSVVILFSIYSILQIYSALSAEDHNLLPIQTVFSLPIGA